MAGTSEEHGCKEERQVAPFLEGLDREFPSKERFSLEEVRRIFGMRSIQSIRNWVDRGDFPGTFRTSKAGGGLRILRQDLIEFYRRYRIQP